MKARVGRKGFENFSDPVPTRYPMTDLDWIDLVVKRTGLGRADVIRRANRVLAAAVKSNPQWNWIAETADPLPELEPKEKEELEQWRAMQREDRKLPPYFHGTPITLPGMAKPTVLTSAHGGRESPNFDKINAQAKAAAAGRRRKRGM